MNQSKIQNATDGQLIKWLANARTTAALAGGHGKAQRNEMLVDEYMRELVRRNIEPPSSKILYALGEFNGEGAS